MSLLRGKTGHLSWNPAAETAFELLKQTGVGAVLSQSFRDKPKLQPIAFFSRFQFMLSYRPGSKNIKADALSQLHSPEVQENLDKFIIPPACILSSIESDLGKNTKLTDPSCMSS